MEKCGKLNDTLAQGVLEILEASDLWHEVHQSNFSQRLSKTKMK